MNNGYYLSAYICVNRLGYLYDFCFRVNQNITLWKYNNGKIELVRYWKLGQKAESINHISCFFSKEDALNFISNCLKECNLSLSDIKEIWGIPELDSRFISYWNVNKNIADHALNHIYSILLLNTDTFYNNMCILLTVDDIVDNIIDKDVYNKNFYAASISERGEICFESSYSPGPIWEYLKRQTNMSGKKLLELSKQCTAKYFLADIPNIHINNHKSMEKGYLKLDKLYKRVMDIEVNEIGVICTNFDSGLTEKENKISMYVKLILQIVIEVMEFNLDKLCEKYNLCTNKCILGISGSKEIIEITSGYLMYKYKFKQLLNAPYDGDSALSIGIGLRAFSLILKDKFIFYMQDLENIESKLMNYKIMINNTICENVKKDNLRKKENPYNLSRSEIGYLCLFEQLYKKLDLKNQDDCNILKSFIRTIERKNPINFELFFKL